MAERILTLNMRKYLVTQPKNKRLSKAVKYIRERVSHYTKIKQDNVKISQQLNHILFTKYTKTMTPLKLNVKIGTDTADVLPFSEKAQQKPAEQPKKKGLISRITKQEPKEKQQPQQASELKQQQKK